MGYILRSEESPSVLTTGLMPLKSPSATANSVVPPKEMTEPALSLTESLPSLTTMVKSLVPMESFSPEAMLRWLAILPVAVIKVSETILAMEPPLFTISVP